MKERLDVFLAAHGYMESREKARRAVLEGAVCVNGVAVTKPAFLVGEGDAVTVLQPQTAYVSRGGYKLEKAISVFHINFCDKIVLDIGASTGGFTDCALQNGAKTVYAVDVGSGQLHPTLRQNPRVINMENQNARAIAQQLFANLANVAVCDVSFISLEHMLAPIAACLAEDGEALLLVKPQFEAGRAQLNKNGVVTNPKTHVAVLNRVIKLCRQTGWGICGLDYSPVKGDAGNVEFLLYVQKNTPDVPFTPVEEVVRQAHLL